MSQKTQKIELKLREIKQLFNSLDPSPFSEKDLDHDAEEFIVSWAREFSLKHPISLRIHLDQWSAADSSADEVRAAIHHYFAYRANMSQLELPLLLRQGRQALLIGLGFIVLCGTIIQVFLISAEPSAWISMARESLTIAGWVAMWRPMQIYLYEW